MLPFHPYADLFPLIEGEEFAALVADVKANDIREKIVVWDGAILDGRNRYRAGLEAGLIDENDGPDRAKYFQRFVPSVDGSPLIYVASRNLLRRHLTPSQRAMLVADLGKMGWGGDRSKSSREGLSISERAVAARVGHATVERADAVKERGISELQDAVRKGSISVAPAADIARLPVEAQRDRLVDRGILPSGARTIMSSRVEPADSLDYFPTPPWATRALFEHVLAHLKVPHVRSAWDPACGEGHMAEAMRSYVTGPVHASDIFDYGYGLLLDYLASPPPRLDEVDGVDWIVSNPPFGDKTEAFFNRAYSEARVGVAMFVRMQWLETNGRYNRIYKDNPPTIIAFFAERVPLCKGEWKPDADTATAYVWLVWMKDYAPQPPMWIPPGQRVELSHESDAENYTQHPVRKQLIRVAPATEYTEPSTNSESSSGVTPQSEAPLAGTGSEMSAGCEGDQRAGAQMLPPLLPGDDLEIPPFLRRGATPVSSLRNPADGMSVPKES